jgi:hypothetical protein
MRSNRRAVLLLVPCCSLFSGTGTFAQISELDSVTDRLGAKLEEAQTTAAIVADFAGEKGGVTLQGVLLADRMWISLLRELRKFRTLHQEVLRNQLAREHTYPAMLSRRWKAKRRGRPEWMR